ncbi:uncharacterized protein LOC114760243 [Neltuma alba]|uniref:uncharacterized protein LOC114760243 n=1 Tax=Neltuma alba TaxID=207710 RepID=UPI0010A55CF9|nr:uncharacterized protein LOC114760243 [Prosopis alba]
MCMEEPRVMLYEREPSRAYYVGGLIDTQVDDAAINNYGEVEEKNRAKKLSDRSVQTHYLKETEDAHQRDARKPERSDQWVDDERTQRRNLHGDNRISMTATDRKPSPEMWRKPAERRKSSDAVDPQCVKATSAVELAQAFSRSKSDPKVNDRLPS